MAIGKVPQPSLPTNNCACEILPLSTVCFKWFLMCSWPITSSKSIHKPTYFFAINWNESYTVWYLPFLLVPKRRCAKNKYNNPFFYDYEVVQSFSFIKQ